MAIYDVIVVGLGTVGSATCMELSRRGISVLGLDACRPPHKMGSHHGESRSIRRAYLEGTVYVPMAQQAWELWRRLEGDTGTRLLTPTGNLTIGPGDAPAVQGFLASARRYDIAHAILTAADVLRRWPQLAMPDNFVAGLEMEAGVVAPEKALIAMLAEAEKSGAVMRFDDRVTGWRDEGNHIRVKSSHGTYEAGRLLLSAGAGTKPLLGPLGKWLAPKRVAVHWVAPSSAQSFDLGSWPVNFWQLPMKGKSGVYHELYALPVTRSNGRVKVAAHNHLEDCDPLRVERTVAPEEVAGIRRFMATYIPSLAIGDIHSDVCLYTMTPDGDFIIGALPGHANVFTTALAGHGFKFAPVLGGIMADMLEDKEPAFDVTRFSPDRFD
ncbi:MAG: N-methyl-L-tryptophan oxidase [Deltaproteobacteria bacterium]|nr:N-methyl-L-tryptophan oxidase [Deltaproteobacteria bacterium]